LKLGLEVGHIVVRVAVASGLAEAHPINDRGVVERIRNNGVLGSEQRLKNTPIGIKCGGIENGVNSVVKVRNRTL